MPDEDNGRVSYTVKDLVSQLHTKLDGMAANEQVQFSSLQARLWELSQIVAVHVAAPHHAGTEERFKDIEAQLTLMTADIGKLREHEVAGDQVEILKRWMIGLAIPGALSVIGLAVTIAKFLVGLA